MIDWRKFPEDPPTHEPDDRVLHAKMVWVGDPLFAFWNPFTRRWMRLSDE